MLASSYRGWGYGENINEIKEMRNYLKKISDENMYVSLKTIIKEEIKEIKNDVYAFCHNISPMNGTSKYYGKPFLYLVNIEDFFHILANLPVSDQSLIIDTFE